MFALRAIKIAKMPVVKYKFVTQEAVTFILNKPIGDRTCPSAYYSTARLKPAKIGVSLLPIRNEWTQPAKRYLAIDAKQCAKEGDTDMEHKPKPATQPKLPSNTEALPPSPFPNKVQVQKFLFRTLAFIWDIVYYLFLWARKYVKDNLAENPKYQEQLRQLKKKMDEAKHDDVSTKK